MVECYVTWHFIHSAAVRREIHRWGINWSMKGAYGECTFEEMNHDVFLSFECIYMVQSCGRLYRFVINTTTDGIFIYTIQSRNPHCRNDEKLAPIIVSTNPLPTGSLRTHCDPIWQHRYGSILTQVMVCLTAPSLYLNQCWLIFTKGVLQHSPESNFTRSLTWSVMCSEPFPKGNELE